MSRHAYLILAHSHFGQLRKLVELLDDSRNDIFIHVDARAEGFDRRCLDGACRYSTVTLIEPRIRVHWGGVSIMRAELELLKAAALGSYDCYHLLSGMDLPIKSQDAIHEFFDRNAGKEFIQMWQMKKSTPSRFRYFTLFPEGAGSFGTNLLNNIFKGLQMAVGFRINRDVDFHFGSQWFSISDELAKYIIDREDWLEKVFRHTNTCDEIFLPTLVWSSPFRDKLYEPSESPANSIGMGNARFIDWTRGESVRHPWTFRNEDWDLLHNVPQMFARKFDESVDNEIIEKIYSELK